MFRPDCNEGTSVAGEDLIGLPVAGVPPVAGALCLHDWVAGQPYPDQVEEDGDWVATFPIKCKHCSAVGTSTVGANDGIIELRERE